MLEMINRHNPDVWSKWVLSVGNITEVAIHTEANRIINFLGVYV